jgi:hypothetical protein
VAFQIAQDGNTPMHVQTREAKDKTYSCTAEPKTCERTRIKAKGQRLKEIYRKEDERREVVNNKKS